MTRKLLFLGPPRVEVDGSAVDLPVKAIALLGYLATAREPAARDRLLGLLWADSAEEAARKNLRNLLWTMRKALGDIIEGGSDRLELEAELFVDARALLNQSTLTTAAGAVTSPVDFERVLSLYRGPFLDGLNLPDAPEYDIWLVAEQEHLAREAVRLAEILVRTHFSAGDWARLATAARAGLVADPLHEPLHRALIEAHARLGQRAEALRQYETLRAALARDLDVEPLPETETLRAAVVAGELDAPPAAPSRPAPPIRPRPAAQEAIPFVGREAERAILDEEMALAQAGSARVVLLSGELGIGKSRLWREWSAASLGEAATLEARCLQATQGLPLAPLVELFAAHPCTQPLLMPGSPVAPAWLAEVARLLPEVRARIPGLPAPAALPLEEERRRVYEAFVQVLLALQARPLVMFVDDVHWIDRTSLDWLAYLSHRMQNRPLLLVLAYRPDEAPPAVVHQVAAWAREGMVRRVPLTRFSPQDVAALVAQLQVDAGSAHRLQAQSGGNPYFLIELSKDQGTEPTPPALADLVHSRIERLPDSARQVLGAAAVLAGDFDLGMLQRVAGRSEEETLDGLDALLSANILAEAGVRYAFTHPLVAGVVRDRLSSARRVVLVRRAVTLLEQEHRDRLGPVAGRLAGYYAELGEDREAARYYDLAAQHALSLAAWLEAVEFRRAALGHAPTLDRRLALGELHFLAGDLHVAREVFAQALSEAESSGDSPAAARACLGMADTFLPAGRAGDVVTWAERSLGFLDVETDPSAHAHGHFLLGAGRLRAGGPALDEAERHLLEAASLAEQHGLAGIASRSRFELGNVFAERGDLRAAVTAYLDSAALAQAHDDPNQQMLAHNNAAYHLMLLNDQAAAQEHIERALGLADAFDLGIARQYLYSTRGEIALAQRDWAEAEQWLTRSLAEATRYGNAEHIAKGKANLAHVEQGRGDLDTALILMEEAVAIARPLTALYLQAQLDLWLARLYAGRQERQAALATLAAAEARLAGARYDRLTAEARALRAELEGR